MRARSLACTSVAVHFGLHAESLPRHVLCRVRAPPCTTLDDELWAVGCTVVLLCAAGQHAERALCVLGSWLYNMRAYSARPLHGTRARHVQQQS